MRLEFKLELDQIATPRFSVESVEGIGKIFTLDGSQGQFTGNYRTQFMNIGLTFPMALALVPISAFHPGRVPWPRRWPPPTAER